MRQSHAMGYRQKEGVVAMSPILRGEDELKVYGEVLIVSCHEERRVDSVS